MISEGVGMAETLMDIGYTCNCNVTVQLGSSVLNLTLVCHPL